MPGDTVEGKVAGEFFITALTHEPGRLIGEMFLSAEVSPVQPKLIGEMMLLAIVTSSTPVTTVRRQPVGGDIQWVDQA